MLEELKELQKEQCMKEEQECETCRKFIKLQAELNALHERLEKGSLPATSKKRKYGETYGDEETITNPVEPQARVSAGGSSSSSSSMSSGHPGGGPKPGKILRKVTDYTDKFLAGGNEYVAFVQGWNYSFHSSGTNLKLP